VEKKALHNFMLFLFDIQEEDIGDIEEELNEAGIDAEKSQKDIMQQIKKARAELKVEKGKRVFEKYMEGVKNIIPGEKKDVSMINELALEFRKLEKNLEGNDITEIMDEAEKMEILKKIIEEEKGEE
jgi:hypothetical protein